MIFWDEEKYSVLVKVAAYRISAQTVVDMMKNISCVIQVGIRRVDDRSDIVLKGNRFYDYLWI